MYGDSMNVMGSMMEELMNEIKKLRKENEELNTTGFFKNMMMRMEDLELEIKKLRKENEELKLNLVSMNPMYTSEQRTTAIEQLINIQSKKEEEPTLNSFFK